MSKIQTDQIADGAVTEPKQTMSDSGGHDHSGTGSQGTPVSRGNLIGAFLSAGTYNDLSPTGLENADVLGIVPSGGNVIITGLDSTKNINAVYIYSGETGVTNQVILKNNDAGSLAVNRFQLSGGNDLALRGADGILLVHFPSVGWFHLDTFSFWNAGDYIWARSSDAGAFSPHWHRLAISGSRLIGRTASSGLKDLTAAEARGVLNVAEIGHGEMYVSTPAQTTVTQQPTYTKISGTTTLGDANGFDMPANNRLRYTGSVTRKFLITGNLTTNATGPDTFRFRIVKNGTTEIAESEQRRYMSGSNDTGSVGVAAIVELAQNDYVEMWVARNGASANMTATLMHVSAIPVS